MNSRRSNGDELNDCRPICADKARGQGPLRGRESALSGEARVRPERPATAHFAPFAAASCLRPVASRRRHIRVVGALLLLAFVVCAGCGQKGDLYLPDESPEKQAER